MPDTVIGDQSAKGSPRWRSPLFMTLLILANSALVVGLLQMLPWDQCAALIIAGVLIAGGVVYLTPAMQRIGDEDSFNLFPRP